MPQRKLPGKTVSKQCPIASTTAENVQRENVQRSFGFSEEGEKAKDRGQAKNLKKSRGHEQPKSPRKSKTTGDKSASD